MKVNMFKAALLALVIASVAACGQGQEAKQESPPTATSGAAVPEWTVTAEGATALRYGEEVVTIAPNPSAPGYQASREIPTAGGSTLVLSYDIMLQPGPGALGILSADRSHWLQNIPLSAGRHTSEVRIPVEGETAHIVIQTLPDHPSPTEIVVHDLRYRVE